MWWANIGPILSLILELVKLIQKEQAKSLIQELKNAKTPEEKKAVAVRLSRHMYD